MKAAVYDINGEPEVFRYEEVADPKPLPGQVLIKVEAICIEGGDLSKRRLSPPASARHILGYAAAGEIIELGSDVQHFVLGQKVVTFDFTGSHAELRAVPASTTFAIPEGLDVQLAIASFIGVGTAAFAIHLSGAKRGDYILVTGATGGVGNATMQLLANEGAHVFATGRNPETLKELKGFGAEETILTGDKSIHRQIRDIRKEGVDIFIDAVGMDILLDGMMAVKDGGKVILLAGRYGKSNFIDPLYIISHRLQLTGCLLGVLIHEPWVRDLIQKGLQSVTEGKVKIPIDRVYKLSEAAKAHSRAEQPGKLGKVLMIP